MVRTPAPPAAGARPASSRSVNHLHGPRATRCGRRSPGARAPPGPWRAGRCRVPRPGRAPARRRPPPGRRGRPRHRRAMGAPGRRVATRRAASPRTSAAPPGNGVPRRRPPAARDRRRAASRAKEASPKSERRDPAAQRARAPGRHLRPDAGGIAQADRDADAPSLQVAGATSSSGILSSMTRLALQLVDVLLAVGLGLLVDELLADAVSSPPRAAGRWRSRRSSALRMIQPVLARMSPEIWPSA